MFDTPFKVALARGLVVGLVMAGAACFGALGLKADDGITGAELTAAAITAGTTFFTYLGGRLLEGGFDQRSPIQRSADLQKANIPGEDAMPP